MCSSDLLAELKGLTQAEVAQATTANFERLFGRTLAPNQALQST